ncbi:phosphotransferase enzyme family protein [Sclerotinia borealis F-4128]|uniref:Phosphotransferase enzyme family protein n=1 Tax=Sclerotinia borealis (strain F-4128) TaxID=1432307 RepID=W9CLB4_SCLBF|nr:phosphotransferase enzyme family protein [Sclerotinia borealis F-4128]
MDTISFPYFRPAEELPAPLPTISEILASNDIIKGTDTWATRKVVRISEHFVVKYGKSNDAIEGQNLLFLEQNGFQTFVPKLYAMWKEKDGTLFLVMECLRGDTLETLWPTLQEADKDRILKKTASIFTQIRDLPHKGLFGSVDECHMPHHLFWWPDFPPNISGLFANERAAIQGLLAKSRENAKMNGRQPYFADIFEEQLLKGLVMDNSRAPVFTHPDLQKKNILVEITEGDNDERDFHVSLIDWESAGWYPIWWEYFVAFIAFKWQDDWCRKVIKVVNAWPAEIALMRMVYYDWWL